MTVFRILALTVMLVLAVALLCAPTYLAPVQAQSQVAVLEAHLTFDTIDVPGGEIYSPLGSQFRGRDGGQLRPGYGQ